MTEPLQSCGLVQAKLMDSYNPIAERLEPDQPILNKDAFRILMHTVCGRCQLKRFCKPRLTSMGVDTQVNFSKN